MERFEFDPILEECTICFSKDISFHIADYKGVQIFKCKNCETQFINPQYTDQFLADFYAKYQQKDFKHHRYGDDKSPRFAKHQDNLNLIEEHGSKGRFFSIGSGNGIDMEVARKRGWEVEGYEIDKSFTENLSKSLDIKMYSGDFANLDLQSAFYDCVYMNHVIEHPKNPGEYLKQIRRIMKKDGILYLATPNINSLSIRLKRLLDVLKLRAKKRSYYDTWQHLTFYDPHHFAEILEKKYGFKVLHLSNDVKKIEEGVVKNSWVDKFLFKSGFRLVAKKVE